MTVFGTIRRHPATVWAALWLISAGAAPLRADELRPVVGPGATRDQVIESYGWPSGQSQSAGKEIFTYPQGRIVLQNGVVERIDFSATTPWAKPKPRPAAPTASTAPVRPKADVVAVAKPAAPIPDPWLTDYAAAQTEARARSVQILALFTGSDWAPLSRKFQAEVATDPTFVGAIAHDYVLLKLDFPTHRTLPPALRQQNLQLRDRFDVTSYPTLIILSAGGDEVSRVNLAKARPEPAFRDQVLAAIREAQPQPSTVIKWVDRPGSAAAQPRAPAPLAFSPWLLGAAVVALAFCWYLLRRRPAAAPREPEELLRLPTPADLAAWPRARLGDVSARLFEFEGWRVERIAAETGVTFALRRGAEPGAEVLVQCQSASEGLAGGHAVRELFASTVAQGVPTAWFVSPGGFTADARQFAIERHVELIGGEEMLARLKAVPPLALVRVLGA